VPRALVAPRPVAPLPLVVVAPRPAAPLPLVVAELPLGRVAWPRRAAILEDARDLPGVAATAGALLRREGIALSLDTNYTQNSLTHSASLIIHENYFVPLTGHHFTVGK
jgi:hypothetical protein